MRGRKEPFDWLCLVRWHVSSNFLSRNYTPAVSIPARTLWAQLNLALYAKIPLKVPSGLLAKENSLAIFTLSQAT